MRVARSLITDSFFALVGTSGDCRYLRGMTSLLTAVLQKWLARKEKALEEEYPGFGFQEAKNWDWTDRIEY